MKILIAHNYYRQSGGEDVVFENEVQVLKSAGHSVRTVTVSNDSILSSFSTALTAMRTVANPLGIAAMKSAIDEFGPDIVHVHNFFPLLSPAIYGVCRKAGVPVVQTLHNYRTICSSALLFRNNKPCELCVRGSPIWGVVYRCYRESALQSAAVARMIAVHRARQTWSTDVDRYIALSEFGRNLYIAAGFPADRIDVKPNSIEDPGTPPPDARSRVGVLYVGRLSPEKGVRFLVEACVKGGYPLRLIGTGPELGRIQQTRQKNVVIAGSMARRAVYDEMRRAAVIVVPSIWYEACPMVVIEAFACGTPVIVSKLGALAELVEDGVTGIHVSPADPASLSEGIGQILRNPNEGRRLGNAARKAFLQRYTQEANREALELIYRKTVNRAAMRPRLSTS